MLNLWQGPMSLVLFIPHPSNTAAAGMCREKLMKYVQHMLETTSSPFALTFFYASEEQLTMDCNVDEHSSGLEPGWIDREGWISRYKGRDFLDIHDGLYPTNHGRNLAVNQVRCSVVLF